MDFVKTLAEELQLAPRYVSQTVALLEEGNTIPFIARYRKEKTGSMDDQTVRRLAERLDYLKKLEERKETVKEAILAQEKWTDALAKALDAAVTLAAVEDIYRPYQQKRATRAAKAMEKGLTPLADYLEAQQGNAAKKAVEFVSEEAGIATVEDALQGAMDILAERLTDMPQVRQKARQFFWDNGLLVTKAVDEEAKSVYEMYYQFQEPVKKVVSHRVLAINRGEKEKFLSVKLEGDKEALIAFFLQRLIRKNSTTAQWVEAAFRDGCSRLLFPAVEREIRATVTEQAEEAAIGLFGKNLKQLLLQPPIKDKIVLAIDPGLRTGCKVAVLDGTGKPLETTVIYPTPPKNDTKGAEKILRRLVEQYQVELFAIGNGTGGRETQGFVADCIGKWHLPLQYAVVSEAGASVYSASPLAAEEFPQYDVSLRSAVSIGRRLQDPLAELVKIEPKAIGVGQYQHDMNQKHLTEALDGVVEDCVNAVGVDLNTASPSLLQYVAGITPTVSKNIVAYREEMGRFHSRKELLKVKKLGPKAYEQCAGFLRIAESENPLDRTGVHPESYDAAKKLLQKMQVKPEEIGKKSLRDAGVDLPKLAKELDIGLPTLKDMIDELEKPGRDMRESMPPVLLRADVLTMDDLEPGMVLSGTVRNVTDFGAFVDIGVHQDGLVHLSQLSDSFVRHPFDVVSVGEVVQVKVLSVEKEKHRISLTMRLSSCCNR